MTYYPHGKLHGEMYYDNNAIQTVIATANTPIALLYMSVGNLNGWTFLAGVHGIDITAYATSDAGARTKVTTAGAHGLSLGNIITISDTTNYNDVYQVMEIVDANNFTIDKPWDGNNDGQGNYDRGDSLVAGIRSSGVYIIQFGMSISESNPAGSDVIVQRYKNKVACDKCVVQRKFANNDLGALSGGSICDVVAGDMIWFVTKSTGTNNITVKYGNCVLARL